MDSSAEEGSGAPPAYALSLRAPTSKYTPPPRSISSREGEVAEEEEREREEGEPPSIEVRSSSPMRTPRKGEAVALRRESACARSTFSANACVLQREETEQSEKRKEARSNLAATGAIP